MKQYQYTMQHKATGRIEFARATAANTDIARDQIVLMYGRQFDVFELHCDVNPAHHTIGEIDCSDFPLTDSAWLKREALKIEA